MSQAFDILPTNPNDSGATVCSYLATKDNDCGKGPFVVFPGSDVGNANEPHVVICNSCLDKMWYDANEGTNVAAAAAELDYDSERGTEPADDDFFEPGYDEDIVAVATATPIDEDVAV